MKIDNDTILSEFGHFARVLVDANLANHHLENIVDKDGSWIFISLFYENVPALCLACHCVGY